MNIIRRCGALVFVLAAATSASAQDYPNRPVTLIVPFAAGGSSDVIARLAAEKVSEHLGQRIVIENMGGAGGSLALARVAGAPPDGYTLAIGNAGTNAAAYTIYPNLRYTPEAFVPIGLVAKTSAVVAIRNDHPAKTLQDFVDFAKKNPGKVTLGHAGVGSSNFIVCKTFLQAAKVDITLVSYRGGGPALNDLLGGQIDGVCDNTASITPQIEGGKVRPLAVASPTRLRNLPQIPTAAEAGQPDFQAQGWNAFFAPKGTPEAVIAKVNAALRKALADTALQTRFVELGAEAATGDEIDPAHTQKLVQTDTERLKVLLAGVTATP